jgi:hypothetical protein
MHNYLITYHGGDMPCSEEECASLMKNWKKWIQDLGDTVVNPGTPLGPTQVITKEGLAENESPDNMMCIAVIKAENLNAAVEIAQTDPCLQAMGGKVKVSQMMEMCS